MYRVIAGADQAGCQVDSEGWAYKTYNELCHESRTEINSDIYGCDVSLYHDDYLMRQMIGHISPPYTLPCTD